MKKFIILTSLIFFFSMSAFAQTSFGFRTGLNFNTLLGELEEGEVFEINNGFHIGFAFNRQFTDIWGARAELVYIKKGFNDIYNGSSSIVLQDRNDRRVTHSGIADIKIVTANTYLNIPISAYGRVTNWLEVSLGVAPGFLIASRAKGDLLFNSDALNEQIAVILKHDYYQDEAGEIADIAEDIITVKELATAKDLTIPSAIGAYYFQEEKDANLYKVFNLEAIFGLSVFINQGLYIGGRVNYGLLDVTNNEADFSFEETTTLRNDKDRTLIFQASVGFNF